ncbi:MAG: c-type cytochrome [Bacteroidota bacterium]
MKHILMFLVVIATFFFLSSMAIRETFFVLEDDESITQVLEKLGQPVTANRVNNEIPGVSAESGRDLVLYGIATDINGKKTSRQSKHFVCTTCHNVEREDPDLRYTDPQARLLYVRDKGLPFLQGSALYGAVNRTTFYNDDYIKKYGDLVKEAKNSIRAAIQLCAVECSQGRPLEDWELESVLAYLWEIDLKVKDLNLNENQKSQIAKAVNDNSNQTAAIELIESMYLKKSPATFVDPPADRKKGYELQGDADNGQLLYEQSCLHCHEGGRYAMFKLDHSNFSLKHLDKHFSRYTRYSTYQVSRYGTSPINGKRAYMPNFTLEKMSNQQLEDLRAYVATHK